MLLTEYDEAKVLAQTVNDERKQTAVAMLQDGEPLEKTKRYSRLAEDAIRKLAETLGLTVV